MRIAALTLLCLCALPAWAQHAHSPYAGQQDREIKALAPEQIADLQAGRGMGASLPAELNGVPGPLHVLQLKQQLQITPAQEAALEQITARMKAEAQQLGGRIIAAERELDQAFRNGSAEEPGIRALSGRIGALNAELRAVHLLAHLQTRKLLSTQQVLAYNEARGYVAAAPEAHRHQP